VNTYTNYGAKPWQLLVEEYGVPEEEARRLLREAEYTMARKLIKRVRDLGYTQRSS